MRYYVAELIVEIPEAGGLASRCRKYLYTGEKKPDVVIDEKKYRPNVWPTLNYDNMCYMESGVQFYNSLFKFNGLMLHSSAVALDGKAYLFSGPCGMGKSTHTRLWQQVFGPAAQVFNDDKPALRHIDGKWYAYGTPWCGKDGINQNIKVPLAGICFLKRADENEIRQLSIEEAIPKVISQTRRRFYNPEEVLPMLQNVEQLVKDIPIFELKNKPEPNAAKLSYNVMSLKAEERKL